MALFGRSRSRREIFRYFDGARHRGIDPMQVYRAIVTHPTLLLDKHMADLSQYEDKVAQAEASKIVAEAAREIFSLTPWSEDHEKGLTELESIHVVGDYLAYCEALKKNGSGPPM